MCNWINSETVQCLFWLSRTSNPFTVPQRTRSVTWCATCLPSQVQAKHCALKWAISAVREGGQRNSAAVSTSQQSTQDTALHSALADFTLHYVHGPWRGYLCQLGGPYRDTHSIVFRWTRVHSILQLHKVQEERHICSSRACILERQHNLFGNAWVGGHGWL